MSTSSMTGRTHRAVSHFGLGASTGDVEAAAADPQGWLEAQLRVADAGAQTKSSREVLAASMAARAARRQAKRSAQGDAERLAALAAEQKSSRRQARSLVAEQTLAQFEHAVATPTPYRERLVRFWSNHFTVSVQGRPQLVGACLPFENEAIRAGLNGRFADLLLGVVSHPVMLTYLDNAQSMGPDSRAGQRSGRGLNENLAREILELHTLGVSGGYEQADVTALAAMLTGWTVGNERLKRHGAEPGAFAFAPFMHQPGSQRLLGKRYPEGGQAQAAAALVDLARHPATARFVAGKLARHFVADRPPEAAVDRLTEVFLATDGHLPSLHQAIVELPEAWEAAERKLKTPYELLVSTHRGLTLPVARPAEVLAPLKLMNHLPFTAPSPAGWPDEHRHWGAPSALTQRVEWAIALGGRVANGVDVRGSSERMVAPDSRQLATSIDRAESASQALGLLLAAPDFQWR